MSVKRLMSLAVAVLSTVAGAETYTWTGAQNGFWTNAANWTVGGEVATKCPGVCSNEIFAADGSTNVGWTTQVALADLAEFPAVADGKATTIDLEGHYCVSSIVFRTGCPVYTLGTSADQVIACQATGCLGDSSYGRFTVESGAAMPVFVAGFSVGFVQKSLQHFTSSSNTKQEWGYLYVDNLTSETMTFAAIGLSRNPGNTTVPHIETYFTGVGGYRFEGPYRDMGYYGTTRQNSYFHFKQSGKVTFAAPQFGRGRNWSGTRDQENYHGLLKVYFDGSCSEMEICEGCRVSLSDWNEPSLGFETDVRIHGGGTLQTGIQSTKPLTVNYGAVYVRSGKTVTVETAFDVNDSSGRTKTLRFNSPSNASNYQGTFFFNGPTNGVNGFVMFRVPMTYKARRTVDFGLGDLALFETDGTFEYVGDTEETFSRRCIVYKDKTAIVKNSGTCPVTVTSVVSPSNDVSGTSFCLQPMTAPVVFAGSFTGTGENASTLVIAGEGVAQIAAEADLTNVKAIRLTGGVFDPTTLADGDAIELTTPVTFDGGEARVAVPDGKTLTLASLAATDGQTAGTLNFLCGTGRVKVSGKTTGDAMPAGVLVNGSPAVFTDDGTLNVTPPDYDTAIGAKGDVVPHAADDVVAIMSEGTSGDDTLASDATAVKELVHFVGADATVAIGTDRSLTAEAIRVYPLAGNLSVGAAEDAGAVSGGGTGGRLLLENRNPVHALTVNAKVASGTDVCVEGGAGTVTLTGGLANGAAVKMTDGTLVLSGAGEYDLRDGQSEIGTASTEALDARLVVDGGAKVTLGENPLFVGSWRNRVTNQKSVARLVVTNATICNVEQTLTSVADSSTNASICVGYRSEAVMEVHAGAVISNRLVVGGVYGSKINGNIKHGAVYQDGGSVTAFGSNSAHGLVIGSEQNANGYYELKGGDFTVLGILAVGYYGRGSFVQFGGTSHFAKPSHFSTWTTVDVGPISQGNGGNATMRFAGGKAKVDDDVRLVLTGGATNRGRSRLTVEEEAELDCGTGAIKLGAVHSNNNYGNTAFFAIRGGAVRAAGFFGGYNSSNPTCPLLNSVGFDGGTLVTSVNGSDIFMGTTSSAQLVTNVIVYAGGMTVDTDGKTGCGTVVPIRGAWGKGVSQISFVAKSGLVAAPVVDIDGDGVGAVAVAEFDSTSGTMTGIKVVNPGAGYTRATVTAWREGGTAFSDTWGRDLSLADNQNTGSFTKKGEGDFTLGAANTWGGDTILKGGVLRLGVTGALPETTTVVYDGGTLAVADGVEPPATLNVEVPNLTDGKKVPLLTFEGSVPATLPTIRCEGLDANEWKFALYGQTLKLAPVRGMTLLVR